MKEMLRSTSILYFLLGTTMVVVLGSTACDLFYVPLEPSTVGWRYSNAELAQYGLAWTRDGSAIVLGYGDSIYFVDVVDGDVSQWVPKDAPPGDYFFQYDLTPDVNPITAEIVFATLRHRIEKTLDFEIIAAGLDGSDYRRLTKSAGSDLAPAWSPDGTRIAFVSERRAYASKEDDLNPGTYHVHIMDADGSNVRVVAPSVSVTPQRPIWSPDGAHLAFRFGYTLYTATVDGSELNVLGKTEIEPAWSPDGQWIAFSQIEPEGEQMRDQELLIARPNGSDVHSVIRFGAGKLISVYLGNLSWSADGLAVRFSVLIGGPSGEYGIYRIGTDGSDLELMVGFDATRMILAWSPDGERIAVDTSSTFPDVSSKDGLLYTIAPDGSEKRVLIERGALPEVGYADR